jgi:hypothetical protein
MIGRAGTSYFGFLSGLTNTAAAAAADVDAGGSG